MPVYRYVSAFLIKTADCQGIVMEVHLTVLRYVYITIHLVILKAVGDYIELTQVNHDTSSYS